jgi:DNA-binding CsgD family transcriptional regulator
MEDLDGLIDRIYAAALQTESWGDVVAEAGARLGATSATSLWFGKNGTELLQAHIWNIDPEALETYQQHYLAFCPRYRASKELDVGAVYDDRHYRMASDGPVRAYYDFMDRYDLGIARIALAEKRPGLTIGMNFYNRIDDGLSADGARVLSLLAPHFRRACNLVQALGDVTERAVLGDAWFAARTASVTLDGQGRTVRINTAAEALLNLRDGLALVQRRLVASVSADQSRLQSEIAQAVGVAPASPAQDGRFVLVSRPSGLPAFAVSAMPLHGGNGAEQAILTIAPTVPQILPKSLQHAFRLTASEACIAAALAKGQSPGQIAADRGVSLQTIRSQIKSIYARLDVRSQGELVSRITAASLGVRI